MATQESAEHEQRDGNRAGREQARRAPPPQAGARLLERVAQHPRRAHALSTRRPCSRVIDAVADAADHLAIVRGDDDGRAARVDLAEQIHDVERQIRIEIAGRLVGQHQLRIVDQRAGDRDALLFAARELLGPARSSDAAGRPTSAPGTSCAAASSSATPSTRMTNATFWKTVKRGIRRKSWKTKPTDAAVRLNLRRRQLAQAAPADHAAIPRSGLLRAAAAAAMSTCRRRSARSGTGTRPCRW